MKLGCVLTAALLALLPAVALGDWSEDFDTYAVGTSLHGVGGWEGWGGSPAGTAYVSADQAFTSPHSVNIAGASDLVHQYSGYTTGQWTYSTMQFVPTAFTGESYFILLNTYGAVNNWSVQIRFDGPDNIVESEFETASLPLVRGQWVEIRAEIDLDADWVNLYYNNQLLSGKVWTDGVSGDGALNIGAVDLFANTGSAVYYDAMALVPEPASILLLVAALALRRR